MEQNFTPDHILQFLYHETSPAESQAIRQALREDKKLQESGRLLAEGARMLPKVSFRPSSRLTEKILAYSRHAEVGREV